MSVEDAMASAPLKDLEADWGDGIFTADNWISIVYPAVYGLSGGGRLEQAPMNLKCNP